MHTAYTWRTLVFITFCLGLVFVLFELSTSSVDLTGHAVLTSTFLTDPPKENSIEAAPGEVLIQLSEGKSLEDILPLLLTQNILGSEQVFASSALPSTLRLRFAKSANTDQIIQELLESGLVDIAEPNYKFKITRVPNDPGYPDQESLHIMNAKDAWDDELGDPYVIIAVVDTGVFLGHDDLAGQFWTNSNEIPNNGLDDDGNGFIDDVKGWNFFDKNNDPDDVEGHGTALAGVIAAKTDNDMGVAGICWHCKIMPVRFTDEFGEGYTSDAAEAVRYAVDSGAQIITASWTGLESEVLGSAMEYAKSHGVLVIAAAGNEGDDRESFPADYPSTLKIAATDNNDARANFPLNWGSNYGSLVDLAAPGVDVLTTYTLPEAYVYISGTSLAVPQVAGAAGLTLSKHSYFSREELMNALRQGVDEFGSDLSRPDQYIGSGRTNLQKLLTISSATSADASISSPQPKDIVSGVVDIRGVAEESYVLEQGFGLYPLSWSGINSGPATVGSLGLWDTAGLDAGLYTLRLTVSDTAGSFAEVTHVTVEATPECSFGQTRPCPNGSDIGECNAGTQTCSIDQTWGECQDQIGPVSEVCDDLKDNDCDNETDENCDLCADGDLDGFNATTCSSGTDCDDNDAGINPEGNELCGANTVDEDCTSAYCRPGDPTEDASVDIFDLTLVGSEFGSDQNNVSVWTRKAKRADTNADGIVDIVDLNSVANIFGRKY